MNEIDQGQLYQMGLILGIFHVGTTFNASNGNCLWKWEVTTEPAPAQDGTSELFVYARPLKAYGRPGRGNWRGQRVFFLKDFIGKLDGIKDTRSTDTPSERP